MFHLLPDLSKVFDYNFFHIGGDEVDTRKLIFFLDFFFIIFPFWIFVLSFKVVGEPWREFKIGDCFTFKPNWFCSTIKTFPVVIIITCGLSFKAHGK